MHVREALERLDAIHDHLTRSEEYRGFRAAGVALAGAVGLLAAVGQPLVVGPDPADFVAFWAAAAGVCAVLGGGAAVHAYARHEDAFARRRTRRVVAQFLPGVVAGGVVTCVLVRGGPDAVRFLPGLWAVLFGLGIVSARPYLPRGIGWVGLFYLTAGSVILLRSVDVSELSGWAVGGVFGPGHLATALVLARDRKGDRDV